MIDRPNFTPQETTKSDTPRFLLGRREFNKKSVITVGAIAAADAYIRYTIATKFKEATFGLLSRERGKIDLLKEVITFLSSPTPEHLIADCYNLNKEITLEESTMQNVAWFVFGDSMNLAYGKHTGPEDQTSPQKITEQKNSWVQMLVDGANTAGRSIGIQEKWHAYNLARLGSSTIGLVGNDRSQTDGNVQLGNKDVQKWIADYKGKPIVTIGLNGNNWRETGAYVIDLYKNDEKFQKFVKAIDPKKSPVEIIKDCLPLLDDDLTKKLNKIFALHEKNAKEFADGFRKAVDIVDKLNEQRRKNRKGLPEITLICTLPINLGLRDVAPYAPPGSMQTGDFDYSGVPNSREAIYRITTTIYQSANNALKEYAQKKGSSAMEIITVPFFGAEKNNNFFAPDGHFTPSGEKFVAEKILSRFNAKLQGIAINLASAITVLIKPENPERAALLGRR